MKRKRFEIAVKATSGLERAFRPGIQALTGTHSKSIKPRDTKTLAGSANIDDAFKHGSHANAHRWDYAIAFKPNPREEQIYWVEIHPANTGGVSEVIAKLQWLKQWLQKEGKELASFGGKFFWLSTGKTSFTQNSPQARQLAANGIQHRGRILNIPDDVTR